MGVRDDEKSKQETSYIERQYFELSGSNENQMVSKADGDQSEDSSYFDSQYFQNVRQLKQQPIEGVFVNEEVPKPYLPDALEDDEIEHKKDISKSSKSLNFSNIDPPARLQYRNQGESIVPDGGSPAEEYAIRLRLEKGINQHLNPDFGFYHQYYFKDVPYWSRKRKPLMDDDEDAFDTDLNEDNNVTSTETRTYIPPNHTLPFHLMTTADICGFLRSSIVHHSNDFIAINKPYGMTCQGGNDSKFDIDRILPSFSRSIGVDELHLIHRLDRNTTGILLLGKNKEAAAIAKKQFQERKVDKSYLAITAGVPYPRKGVIRDPVQVFFNHKSHLNKMFLAPQSKESLNAVTRYEVLFFRQHAALVECFPETGYRHQIRTHLAQSLGCPILGDHKYATPAGDKPQELPPRILDSFNMRSGKARYLMMHLHASRMTFPYHVNGRNEVIDIKARIHRHFINSMKYLRLRFPNVMKIPSRIPR